jgi:hypothetical protein
MMELTASVDEVSEWAVRNWDLVGGSNSLKMYL